MIGDVAGYAGSLHHSTSVITVVLLCTLPWWLAPFVIRRMVKTPIDVVCEYCDGSGIALPNDLIGYFAEVEAGLVAVGFRPRPPFRMRSQSRRTDIFIQLYDRPETGDIASVAGVVTEMASMTTVLRRTEFRTAFADGTQQWTSNFEMRDPYGSMPGVTTTRLPRLQEPPHLYRAHRRLVAERRGTKVVAFELGDPIKYQVEFERKERDFKLSGGYSYEDRAARVIRPTWRGALALHVTTAPGFKQFNTWRIEREQAATLRRIGVAI